MVSIMSGWSPQQPISKIMQRGSLAKHFEYLRIAKRIAAIINPACQEAKFGIPITADCLRISLQQVRAADTDAYAIDIDEDPRSLYRETIVVQVGLPNNSAITRFKQILPTVTAALSRHGFGALQVKPVLDDCGHHPAPFLSTETGPAIGGPGAREGAKALAERLPETSPLKASMKRLAESLEKHGR